MFLLYGRDVDPTMLNALSSITLQQSDPTSETMKQSNKFLYYCASQENAITNFQKNDMKLAVHRNAGYMNKIKSRRRVGGGGFMSNCSLLPPNNEAMITIKQIIKSVMLYEAEAKLGALFIIAREVV